MIVNSNLTELEAQLVELQTKVETERARVKSETLAAIEAMLANGTISADDLKALLPHAAPRARPPRNRANPPKPPMYKDPVSGATWTGQGASPNWLKGKNRDDFLIVSP